MLSKKATAEGSNTCSAQITPLIRREKSVGMCRTKAVHTTQETVKTTKDRL